MAYRLHYMACMRKIEAKQVNALIKIIKDARTVEETPFVNSAEKTKASETKDRCIDQLIEALLSKNAMSIR